MSSLLAAMLLCCCAAAACCCAAVPLCLQIGNGLQAAFSYLAEKSFPIRHDDTSAKHVACERSPPEVLGAEAVKPRPRSSLRSSRLAPPIGVLRMFHRQLRTQVAV